jgi:hypothetical protein
MRKENSVQRPPSIYTLPPLCLLATSDYALSRTQVLPTKIAQLCKEIRDINGTIKTNNIVPRLPESTINTNRNKDRIDGPGIDDHWEQTPVFQPGTS